MVWSVLCWLLILIATLYDWHFSVKRLTKHGLGVELNPLVVWPVKLFGLKRGLFLAIVPGSLLIGLVTGLGGFSRLLGFFTGIKAAYFVLQLTAPEPFES